MDTPDWNRRYEVLSMSRADLSSFGLSDAQIKRLSDADMEHVAQQLRNQYIPADFPEDVVFLARLENHLPVFILL